MSYDFTKAKDLANWAKAQYKKKNRYKRSGIGRYDPDGTRQFDCCGLFKCFMWHDYSTTNAKYYGKVQKDIGVGSLLAEAKEKGKIATIPEIPGILVYQLGHMGIYIGNGMVIEATARKYDGKNGKIYKTYFKGSGEGCDGKRTTWTKWYKSPYLSYEEEKTKFWTTGVYKVLVSKYLRKSHSLGDNYVKVKETTAAMRDALTSTSPNAKAKIKVGRKITILEVYTDSENRVWGRNYSGWVVLCNKDGTPQMEKV